MEALILFAKDPERGSVKTRLAKNVGDETARNIYVSLLNHTRDVASAVQCKRYVFVDGSWAEPMIWNGKQFEMHVQRGGDLGERMANALEVSFTQGCDKAVLVGSDIPDLSPAIIEDAFRRLDGADIVIGPANDGGYYLLGAKALNRELFREIPWSTTAVLEATLGRARDANLSVVLIEQLTDLDTVEDFESIRSKDVLAQMVSRPFGHP